MTRNQDTGVGSDQFAVISSYVMAFGVFLYVLLKWRRFQALRFQAGYRCHRLIVISGCDSGLGLSMAVWAAESGYQVLAGCLNYDGEGARYLKQRFSPNPENGNDHSIFGRVFVVPLDVTKEESIAAFRDECENILQSSPGETTKLWALVPNAAVAVFGEFFWQTKAQQESQMKVNFWGTVNLTSAFERLLFQNKSRVVVVSSDCSDYPLPFFSIYCASKAALQTWTRCLRLEVAKYGVTVVAYQPGSFPYKSQMMWTARDHFPAMEQALTSPQKKFYGQYFMNCVNELKNLFHADNAPPILPINDENKRRIFISLMENDLGLLPVWVEDPLESWIFHFLLRYLPQKQADKLSIFALTKQVWHEDDQENMI